MPEIHTALALLQREPDRARRLALLLEMQRACQEVLVVEWKRGPGWSYYSKVEIPQEKLPS